MNTETEFIKNIKMNGVFSYFPNVDMVRSWGMDIALKAFTGDPRQVDRH